MGFVELGISQDINKGLSELGIHTPTKIQAASIPILISSKTDFIGQAQTGTGKTAAFGLPILSNIDTSKNNIQALILAPTRELVQQIAKQLFKFTKYSEQVFTEAVYGGEKIDIQMGRLNRPTHIVVATPGRLLDLVNKKALDLSDIKTLVLDEADEMLSMGFKEDLNRILKLTKGDRNIWLFSATIPKDLDEIINTYVSPDAIRINIDKNEAVNKNIVHHYVVGEEASKLDTLTYFLKSLGKNRGIIFTRTKATAKTLSKQLVAKNYNVDLLEGDMHQKDRDKAMRAFKNENVRTLISTDVAARGIDVDNLAYVVHYQLPDQVDYYTHRSGRTARAGKTGVSLVLATKADVQKIFNLEKQLGIKFTKIT